MKNIIKGSVALIAMVASATAAFAGPSDKVVYSNPAIQWTNTQAPVVVLGFPVQGPAAAQNAWNLAQGLGGLAQNLSGARYQQSSTVAGNTETATPTVTTQFSLSGSVEKDCSFYAGGASSQQINLGTIGVRTGNNDNVTIAFNQASDINANINTSTAGCNTNNTITITKGNGVDGLKNAAAVAYDSNQFTNKIPYSIAANWTGVATGSTGSAGTAQTLAVASNDDSSVFNAGAWRSSFSMNVNAPAQSKGLIAGTYADTITVELKAI